MPSKGREAARLKIMETEAVVAGRKWAGAWKRDIVSEGRAVAGGWPGTITQARAKVYAHIHPILRDKGMRLPSTSENEETARALYRCAREFWLNGDAA